MQEPQAARATALARIAEIAADLGKLSKPWPEWVVAEEEQDAPDEAPPEEADEPAPPEEVDEPAPPDEVDDSAPPDEVDDSAPPDEVDEPTRGAGAAPDLDVNTGETEVPLPERVPEDDEEPPAESTVVLRSVPIVLYLEREGEEPVRVATERFIIGRGPQCDLIIDSPRVSREHLAVTRSGIQYFIEDLNSSNGTWLGEERISTRELESGDVINLGNEPVTFWLRPE